jgi:hypothetical protein
MSPARRLDLRGTTAASGPANALAKNAWVLLLATGILGGLRSLALLVGHASASTGALTNSPAFALLTLAWSAAVVAIAAVSFRKGQAWSWYLCWHIPVVYAALGVHGLVTGEGRGPVAIVPLLAVAMSLVALFASYRIFFPAEGIAPA